MILEIALGIVLAVIILRFLPLITAGAVLLVGVGIVLLLVGAALVYSKDILQFLGEAAITLLTAAPFVAAIWIPFYLHGLLQKRFPWLAPKNVADPSYELRLKQQVLVVLAGITVWVAALLSLLAVAGIMFLMPRAAS